MWVCTVRLVLYSHRCVCVSRWALGWFVLLSCCATPACEPAVALLCRSHTVLQPTRCPDNDTHNEAAATWHRVLSPTPCWFAWLQEAVRRIAVLLNAMCLLLGRLVRAYMGCVGSLWVGVCLLCAVLLQFLTNAKAAMLAGGPAAVHSMRPSSWTVVHYHWIYTFHAACSSMLLQ
jgi:hypothetical protein